MTTVLEVREPLRVNLPRAVFQVQPFSINAGDLVAVFGCAEAWVSEFLRFLGGQFSPEGMDMPPAEGEIKSTFVDFGLAQLPIFLGGARLYGQAPIERVLGFIDSDPDQSIIGRTVLEEYYYSLIASGADAEAQIAALQLRSYGLSEKLAVPSSALSGGEKQRLSAAGAFAGSPLLVVADLSASSLDSSFIETLVKALAEFCRSGGAAVVSGLRWEELSALPGINVRPWFVEQQSSELRVREQVPPRSAFPTLESERRYLAGRLVDRNIGERVVSFDEVHRKDRTEAASFAIEAGEIVRLVGYNGSGKTTLGHILVGRTNKRSVRGKVEMAAGAVPSMAPQFPARGLLGTNVQNEIPVRALQALCGVEGLLDEDPRELPFATMKLLTVATALVSSRRLVVLDEPTCGMDYQHKKRVVDLINHFEELAILLITHDPALEGVGRQVQLGA